MNNLQELKGERRRMKPINETHPSLTGKMIDNTHHLATLYTEKDVQKHTIDKAVLREAINKHFVCGYEQGLSGAVHSRNCRKCALMKELGLEKEK